MEQALPPKTHNVAAVELGIAGRLTRDYAPTIDELELLAARADAQPKNIEDDDAAAPLSDLVRDVTASLKRIESHREKEKEPYLKSGREVDGFFKPLAERGLKIKRAMEDRLGVWLRTKAARERAAQEEAARLAAQEAQDRIAAAMAAEAAGKPVEAIAQTEAAIVAERRSNDATALAEAKPADLSRLRSQAGAVSSLREDWDFSVENYDEIDLSALRPFLARAALDTAIRAFVRAGRRDLGGVRIYQVTRAVVR